MGKKTSEQGGEEVRAQSDDSGEISLAPENGTENDATLIFEESPASPQAQASAGGNSPPKGPPVNVSTGGNGDEDDGHRDSDGSTFGNKPFVVPDDVRADIQELNPDGVGEAAEVLMPASSMLLASEKPARGSLFSNLVVGAAAAIIVVAMLGNIAVIFIKV